MQQSKPPGRHRPGIPAGEPAPLLVARLSARLCDHLPAVPRRNR
jgi:hypothetical protein